HVDLNPNYFWEQPEGKFDFESFIKRGGLYLPKGTKLPSAAQMEDVCRALEEEISADDQVSNLFKVKDRRRGIRLPWFLPQMDIDVQNPGKVIHEFFKPAIKAAYEEQFKGRNFVDYRENDTDGQVTIVDESQLRLVSALREGPVFGWIFPAVFQGIGIEGDRALMKTLPTKHSFVLGGFESLMATILHTKVLCRDNNTPVQDLASFQWRDPGGSLCVYALDSELGFAGRGLDAGGHFSAALSVFRQCK
ncbi:MAG: hypothetical protein Q8R07_04685, partial [Candidatus Uhrbacteria bacterium]|nr:hypothetical protein [Candidatus Uhrbacteria bacterium]